MIDPVRSILREWARLTIDEYLKYDRVNWYLTPKEGATKVEQDVTPPKDAATTE